MGSYQYRYETAMAPASDTIIIDDLARPILSEQQQSALEYGETLSIDLSRAAILQQAREETGLSDFGDEEFLQRLDLLVDEWNGDSGLTGIGRLSLRNKLLLFARNRLLIADTLKQHPEIHQIEIDKPIIVAGLPRSGTTHLLNLMAADRRLHSLPLWQSYEPIAMPGEAPLADGTDPRYQRCADQWQTMQQMTPLLAAMHPMNPDHIHEELELMGPDFASYNFEWLSMSPRWRDHYYATDQTPHYQYMKTVLKILQWQRGPGRWVLKCPQHLEQLPTLYRVFPDATVVITHRDPVAVIQSAITMLAYGQRLNRRRVEMQALADYWCDRIEHLLRACVRDRAILPRAQSIDVPFDQFMADDVAMVERIYEKAGLAMNSQAREDLNRYMQQHPRGKQGRIVYRLQQDFGVDPESLRRRFNFYFERFPVAMESG
jgi:hypothetical protein